MQTIDNHILLSPEFCVTSIGGLKTRFWALWDEIENEKDLRQREIFALHLPRIHISLCCNEILPELHTRYRYVSIETIVNHRTTYPGTHNGKHSLSQWNIKHNTKAITWRKNAKNTDLWPTNNLLKAACSSLSDPVDVPVCSIWGWATMEILTLQTTFVSLRKHACCFCCDAEHAMANYGIDACEQFW